jgi:alkanesulfonate monooxygenase SsuD/methylene tetrahydromethanopterin reductase-like flavin-dependent oxidoreductase (luciferase family)
MIPLAARLADVWHCFEPLEALRGKVRVFDEHAERAGREPSSIGRATSISINDPWDEVADRAEAIRSLGFDYLVIEWPVEGRPRLESFVQQVMPSLAD